MILEASDAQRRAIFAKFRDAGAAALFRSPAVKQQLRNKIAAHQAEHPQGTLKQLSAQQGSNPGGLYADENQQKWYVKHYRNPEQGKTEVASARIHRLLGLNAPHATMFQHDGKEGFASRWQEGLERADPDELAALPRHERAKTLLASALTANRDVVGLEYDNMLRGPDKSTHLIDQGGSFEFRAQGGPKAYGPEPIELDGLRNPDVNAQAHHVFGDLTDKDLQGAAAEMAKVPPAHLSAAVSAAGLPGRLATTLLQRRSAILKRFQVPDKSAESVRMPSWAESRDDRTLPLALRMLLARR